MDFTSVSGFVQTFLETQEDTHGEYVDLLIVLRPGGGGAPLHVHPHQEERFEVTDGVLDVYHSGTWHKVRAGEAVIVPPGTPDQFRNTSGDPVTLRCRLSPVLDFQDMNVAMMKLIDDGRVKSQRDLKSIVHSAMLLQRFPKSVRMLNPMYRWTTAGLATLGKFLGYSID